MKRKLISIALVFVLCFSLAACGSKKDNKDTSVDANKENTQTPTKEPEATKAEGEAANEETPDYSMSLDQIELGKYTDITATIKFATHRTDLVDNGRFTEYVAEFNKVYPNIKVEYEGITDYKETMDIRLTQKDWGTMCMIPTSIDKVDLGTYFEPIGSYDVFKDIYNFCDDKAFDNVVYGLSSTGNAQGIVYNKKVFETAGISSLPKTPDEFLDCLQKIKDTGAAEDPYYSNYKDDWAISQWNAHIGGSTNGDPEYYNNMLPYQKNPFGPTDDFTGPYSAYYLIYNIAARGLCEEDPVTTDWEGCKGRINRGEIGVMAMGSWAVTQFQQADSNPQDIGYMPFPLTINGKQYASAGADYCYGININADEVTKFAAKIYTKWLVEQSNFSYNEGGIPILKTGAYPEVLNAFSGVEFIVNNPAAAGEEDTFNAINAESEMNINVDGKKAQYVFWEGFKASKGESAKTLEDLMAEFNEAWSDAQSSLGIEVKY